MKRSISIIFNLFLIKSINIIQDIKDGVLTPHEACSSENRKFDRDLIADQLKSINIQQSSTYSPIEIVVQSMLQSTVFDGILFQYETGISKKELVSELLITYGNKTIHKKISPASLHISNLILENNNSLSSFLGEEYKHFPFFELLDDFILEVNLLTLVDHQIRKSGIINYLYSLVTISDINRDFKKELEKFEHLKFHVMTVIEIGTSFHNAFGVIAIAENGSEELIHSVMPEFDLVLTNMNSLLDILYENVCSYYSFKNNSVSSLVRIIHQYSAIKSTFNILLKKQPNLDESYRRSCITNYILSLMFVKGNLVNNIESIINKQ